jgi:hypothetical protein
VILGTASASSHTALAAGPFLGACGLLVIAGFAKVFRPAAAYTAVRAVGLRLPRGTVVAFGLFEVGAALVGAVFGGRAALGVAACYLVLTVFAVQLLRRAPATPCACLVSSSAVVTRTHVVVNVAAVVVASVTAFGGAPFDQLAGHWIQGAVFAVLVACCVKLASLALETLPELAVATKEGSA